MNEPDQKLYIILDKGIPINLTVMLNSYLTHKPYLVHCPVMVEILHFIQIFNIQMNSSSPRRTERAMKKTISISTALNLKLIWTKIYYSLLYLSKNNKCKYLNKNIIVMNFNNFKILNVFTYLPYCTCNSFASWSRYVTFVCRSAL